MTWRYLQLDPIYYGLTSDIFQDCVCYKERWGLEKKSRVMQQEKKVYVEVKQASATRRIYVHFLIGFYGWPELR